MTDFPFVTSHVTPGARFDGAWHTGDIVAVRWTNSRVDSPCGSYGYAVNFTADATYYGEHRFAASDHADTFSVVLTHDASAIYVNAYTDSFCSTGYIFGVTVSGGGTGFCQYGVEPNPAASVITTVTAAIVDTAILLLGGGPVAILAFDTLIGAPLLLGDLCIQPPPTMPTFTNADFIPGTQIWSPGSFDKRMLALKATIWGFYCQCVPAPPGSPAPVDYPAPPALTLPVATGGTVVTSDCTQEDICSTLNTILRQLAAINNQITYARTDIQLIQRQNVPFGYVHGPAHGPVTGAGEFAVADILGLLVQCTSVPGFLGEVATDPVTHLFLGEVALGTVDGWGERIRLTRNPQVILGVSGAVTTVGYTLDGTTALFTELVREP